MATQSAANTSSVKMRPQARRETIDHDAVAFLGAQHREVEALVKQFEKLGENGPVAEKEAIVREACKKLTVHAQIQEEIFHPAAREVREVDALLNEAEVEHGIAKVLISALDAMEAEDDLFDAHFTVLSEYIKHHVQEEEGDLFPKVRKGDLDPEQLGQELATRAQELRRGSELP